MNYAGHSIRIDGDVDADGKDDLLMGAYFNDEAGTYAGKTYLFLGSSLDATTPGEVDITDADYMWTGASSYDESGGGLVFPGDIDGDSADELLIGAKYNDDGATDAGSAYLFLSASLTTSGTASVDTADYQFIGSEAGAACGAFGPGAPGDIDGDGTVDLWVPCPYSDYNGTESGAVYIFLTP